jgi:hypothetical protein
MIQLRRKVNLSSRSAEEWKSHGRWCEVEGSGPRNTPDILEAPYKRLKPVVILHYRYLIKRAGDISECVAALHACFELIARRKNLPPGNRLISVSGLHLCSHGRRRELVAEAIGPSLQGLATVGGHRVSAVHDSAPESGFAIFPTKTQQSRNELAVKPAPGNFDSISWRGSAASEFLVVATSSARRTWVATSLTWKAGHCIYARGLANNLQHACTQQFTRHAA